jgi:hypothetical protein
MRRTIAAVVAAIALVVAPGLAAHAAPVQPSAVQTVVTAAKVQTKVPTTTAKKFKNCTALNKTYPGGVAKNSKVHNTKTVAGHKVRAKSTHKPKVSASLYKANSGLDRDKDGIACER